MKDITLKTLVIITVCLFYSHTLKWSYYFIKAELAFTKGLDNAQKCKSIKTIQSCVDAANLYQESVVLNKDQYFYRYVFAKMLFGLYNFTKNKELVEYAIKHLNRSERYAYDKHIPHIEKSIIYNAIGKKREAVIEIEKALKYIPHNKKVNEYYDRIR